MVINEGSGHSTPRPTIDVSAAATVNEDLNVYENTSVISSFFFSTVFLSALPASNLGGFGFGHNN